MRRTLLLVASLPFLSASPPQAQSRHPASWLAPTLDTLVPSLLTQYRVPGVAIAIVRAGALQWSRGYGLADVAARRPVTDDTRFNIGSTSKSLTAWAVMSLAARRRIDLDAPVDRYLERWRLPRSEFDNEKVTVRRVLSHTAGLSVRGYHGVHVAGDSLPTLVESLNGYSGSDGALRVEREPGKEIVYSSGGFTMLQLLIEDLTGERFADFMRRTLFAPLAMHATGYDWTPELRVRIATPYNEQGVAWPFYLGPEQASGGVYTTASDLARFVAASMSGSRGERPGRGILSPDALLTMLTPADATGGQYGLGYKFLPVPGGPRLVSHDGANEGWRANFFMNPPSGDGLVMLINSDAGGRIAAPIVCAWAATTTFDMSALCATVRR